MGYLPPRVVTRGPWKPRGGDSTFGSVVSLADKKGMAVG